MKTKTIYKRIAFVLCALFLLAFAFIGDVFYIAKADEPQVSVKDYSTIEIEDEGNVDGVNWTLDVIENYNFGDAFQVLRVQEYCFSKDSAYDEYYGLYVYVFNPSGKEVGENERVNVVNLSTKFNEEGEPIEYKNVRLLYCDDAYDNTVYKFKVDLSDEYKSTLKAYANKHGKRRYDVASVQLRFTDRKMATDTTHAKTYLFSGYAKGLNGNSESSLTCTEKSLNTIELDVNHTFYRTHDYQDYVCDQLNTVYFSVDENYFADEKSLYGIKAEWYEYKTTPIFITNNLDIYKKIKPYRCDIIDYTEKEESVAGSGFGGGGYGARSLSTGETYHESDLDFRILWEGKDETSSHIDLMSYYKLYGKYGSGMDLNASIGNKAWEMYWTSANKLSTLSWLFYRGDIETLDNFNVSGAELEAYVKELVASGKTDADNLYLFEDSIDKDRAEKFFAGTETKKGYIEQEIFADDKVTFTEQTDQSWWDRLWHGIKFEETGYCPIVVFDQEDKDVLMGMTPETFASTYYVNNGDAETVRQYCLDELNAGNRPVLFRFANTDYYVSDAVFSVVDDDKGEDFTPNGYVAQTTVFEDFDVISLSFKDYEGTVTVVPVSADPINIYSGVEPNPDSPLNPEDDSWLDELLDVILMVGGLILLGVVLIAFGPLLISVFGKLFGTLLNWLWKGIKLGVKIAWAVIVFPFNIPSLIKKRRQKKSQKSD